MNKTLIETAQKQRKADLVLKNARIPSVFTGQILEGDLAIVEDRSAGIGSYEGKKEIDLNGALVLPGLIDAHFHIESTMCTPASLSEALLRHGVTTVIADPHEIANAAGVDGLDFIMEDAQNALIDYFFMIPSSVPSCDFEVNGAGELLAKDMKPYLNRKNVLGLAEVMRMNDVLSCDPRMQEKIELFEGRPIDGHAPGLSGSSLQAYRAAGIRNDHEAATAQEALERLNYGFQLLIRQGSGARNLEDLLTGLVEQKIDLNRCSLCTDDMHIEDILSEGTIDHDLVLAQQCGTDFMDALRMGSLNTAVHYGLQDRGAIAPGYLADLVIINDPKKMDIQAVVRKGKVAWVSPSSTISGLSSLVEEQPVKNAPLPESITHSVHLPEFSLEELKEGFEDQYGIAMVEGQLYTRLLDKEDLQNEEDHPNILLSSERYGKSGEYALCPLVGYGLKNGAVAMSYAHDSHNVIACADRFEYLIEALKILQEIQGGVVVIEKDHEPQVQPLEAAGLMSQKRPEQVSDKVLSMKNRLTEMGVNPGIDPFATLSFLSLPVIPEVRLTPQGLFDVTHQTFLVRGKRKAVKADHKEK